MAAITRVLIQYLLLVGLPAIGIAAALQAGTTVRAPADISGQWHVTAISRGTVPGSCLASVGRDGPIPLRITQSGRYLSARMRGWHHRASGSIESGRITLDWPGVQEPPCVRAVRIDAQVAKETDGQLSLSGTMRIRDCSECGVARFVAEKQATAVVRSEVP
jgi:hypothetical protein